MKKTTTRKCKNCKESFTPRGDNQIVCTVKCATELQKKKREKLIKEIEKQDRRDIREMKEKLKTTKDYVKELQVIFNTFIRERDKNLPCISCGRINNARWTAGHYFPAGSYPMVRFDEDNVHKQCWWNCNKNQHGNLANYKIGLLEKIGEERLTELELRIRTPKKYTIPELIEMKAEYKLKIKSLENTRHS